MSQNIMRTASCQFGAVRISAGWDRRQYVLFCNVLALWDEDEDEENEEAQLPDCFYRMSYDSVDEMVRELALAGITMPESMAAAIRQDIADNVGNTIRVFLENGTLESEVSV